MSRRRPSNCPLSWEVVFLVADHLDPKTLAMASCVCKSWSITMSSEYLWKQICTTHFPSISNLRAVDPAVPYRRLYAIGYESVKRRLREPLKPRLSLADIIFTIDIVHLGTSRVVTIVKPGGELDIVPYGLFRFYIELEDDDDDHMVVFDALEDDLKFTWNVVLGGFKGVFTVMDVCKGKGCFKGTEGWFLVDVPSCFSGVTTHTEFKAEIKLGLRSSNWGHEKMVIEKLSVGALSVMGWRYASMDDVLRYLQHFLFCLPYITVWKPSSVVTLFCFKYCNFNLSLVFICPLPFILFLFYLVQETYTTN
ncbi:probable F-box protein At5g04010 [Cornus florida]|uniref:probable F-box protein At5g04010 n=1 Tax=Cornus florida TaxID=4283 RepID=UPI00289D3A45|nr:probable F-box protein At5g04010 [Cornus florida]